MDISKYQIIKNINTFNNVLALVSRYQLIF